MIIRCRSKDFSFITFVNFFMFVYFCANKYFISKADSINTVVVVLFCDYESSLKLDQSMIIRPSAAFIVYNK